MVALHDEGVVKFVSEYAYAPPLDEEAVRELAALRNRLVELGVVGQEPARYGGYGFGNVSRRLTGEEGAEGGRPFLITGTQTGGVTHLRPEHFVVVTECHPEENRIVARGPIQPSSESMTHGALYALDDAIRWVIHGHSPELWHAAGRLAIPTTDAAIPYGTPEMSAAVAELWHTSDMAERRILAMGGHEDGIVTFGASAEETLAVLVDTLKKLRHKDSEREDS